MQPEQRLERDLGQIALPYLVLRCSPQVEQRHGRSFLGRPVGAGIDGVLPAAPVLDDPEGLPVIESRAWYDTLPP